MVDDHILDAHLLGQVSGVQAGHVAALVGLVDVPVGVEAVGLAEQPLGPLGVFFRRGLDGLVSGKAEVLPLRQIQKEAELLHFLGADVKSSDVETGQIQLLPVGDLPEEDLAVKKLCQLFAQDHLADGPDIRQSPLAGCHGKGAGVALLRHGGGHCPDDPGGAQNVVAVAVGHEHTAKGGDGDPQLVQPDEDLAAAAGIH